MATIVVGRKGQQKMAISDMAVSSQHCQITDNADGTYIVKDLNSLNGTYIDGRRIFQKTVKADTVIALGPNFSAKVCELLGVKAPPPEFDVSHLRYVWERYDAEKKRINKVQKKLGMMSRVYMALSAPVGIISAVGPEIFGGERNDYIPLYILTAIGVVLLIVSMIKQNQFDPQLEIENATMELENDYKCPNTNCGRYFGMKRYNLLVQEGICPFCRSKLVEKKGGNKGRNPIGNNQYYANNNQYR